MSLNIVALVGRLTRDPELKTAGQVSVCSFTVAVDRKYVTKGKEREADYISVVAWRNTAEFICKYFKKGNQIAVSGYLQYRKYTDKDGNNRSATEVVAENASFVESKNSETTTESFDVVGPVEDLPF